MGLAAILRRVAVGCEHLTAIGTFSAVLLHRLARFGLAARAPRSARFAHWHS